MSSDKEGVLDLRRAYEMSQELMKCVEMVNKLTGYVERSVDRIDKLSEMVAAVNKRLDAQESSGSARQKLIESSLGRLESLEKWFDALEKPAEGGAQEAQRVEAKGAALDLEPPLQAAGRSFEYQVGQQVGWAQAANDHLWGPFRIYARGRASIAAGGAQNAYVVRYEGDDCPIWFYAIALESELGVVADGKYATFADNGP